MNCASSEKETNILEESFFTWKDLAVDGVAVGSPLYIMAELEIAMIPSVGNYLQNRKQFVDDTFAFMLPDKIG